ncbi:hypothetical protein [Phthorimaea operculella granulovirus]|uniref:Uncharacterized protein n=1 Tax=Phthorimaea operculella granulovirus TaxID=192584 RepID=Q8JS37_9BBAC|nr:hypothetical protein [Phthorimaea operculella granulovirus]AAM70220.1 unknown [Phthorimaea operculella granulovirus]ANY57411.1 hypothetical protein PhopGVgp022 [Phthorimaea operculella granulovirus]QBH65857.1 hypothetical protein PhopGVgp022 [Phthorimaea operculella granulovirus]QBH65987.1 hypothetical protein PhopGVgp022 [Phthorimaea operculella granulovirus]QBH66117.1 hypothetical protein PhopGVgp022 [Phthorimaea operculella granulovirus]
MLGPLLDEAFTNFVVCNNEKRITIGVYQTANCLRVICGKRTYHTKANAEITVSECHMLIGIRFDSNFKYLFCEYLRKRFAAARVEGKSFVYEIQLLHLPSVISFCKMLLDLYNLKKNVSYL